VSQQPGRAGDVGEALERLDRVGTRLDGGPHPLLAAAVLLVVVVSDSLEDAPIDPVRMGAVRARNCAQCTALQLCALLAAHSRARANQDRRRRLKDALQFRDIPVVDQRKPGPSFDLACNRYRNRLRQIRIH
jgi:hypothetical protein